MINAWWYMSCDLWLLTWCSMSMSLYILYILHIACYCAISSLPRGNCGIFPSKYHGILPKVTWVLTLTSVSMTFCEHSANAFLMAAFCPWDLTKTGKGPQGPPCFVLCGVWIRSCKSTHVDREISLAIKVMLHSFCARFTWPRRVIGKWRAKLIHSWIQRHQGAFTHKTKKCKYHRSIAKCKYITPCLSKSWASSHFWRTGFNLSCNFLLASRIASIAWRSCPSENVPHRSLEKTFLVSLLSSRAVMIQVDNLRLHLLYGRVIKFPESHV